MSSDAVRHRDEGLRRVSAATRWVAAGSAACAGAFAFLAAHPKVLKISRGTATSPVPTTAVPSVTDPSVTAPGATDPGAANLAPPEQVPVESQAPAQVTTGAS